MTFERGVFLTLIRSWKYNNYKTQHIKQQVKSVVGLQQYQKKLQQFKAFLGIVDFNVSEFRFNIGVFMFILMSTTQNVPF